MGLEPIWENEAGPKDSQARSRSGLLRGDHSLTQGTVLDDFPLDSNLVAAETAGRHKANQERQVRHDNSPYVHAAAKPVRPMIRSFVNVGLVPSQRDVQT